MPLQEVRQVPSNSAARSVILQLRRFPAWDDETTPQSGPRACAAEKDKLFMMKFRSAQGYPMPYGALTPKENKAV